MVLSPEFHKWHLKLRGTQALLSHLHTVASSPTQLVTPPAKGIQLSFHFSLRFQNLFGTHATLEKYFSRQNTESHILEYSFFIFAIDRPSVHPSFRISGNVITYPTKYIERLLFCIFVSKYLMPVLWLGVCAHPCLCMCTCLCGCMCGGQRLLRVCSSVTLLVFLRHGISLKLELTESDQ